MALLHFNGMVAGDSTRLPAGFTGTTASVGTGSAASRTTSSANEVSAGAVYVTGSTNTSSTSSARLDGIRLPVVPSPRLFTGFGFRRIGSNTSYRGHICSFWDGPTSILWIGEVDGTYASDAEVRLGGQTGTVVATISALTHPLFDGSWWYIEIDLTCDPVNGAVKIRINGSDVVVDISGLNTGTQLDGLVLGYGGYSSYSTKSYAFDDLYVCDDTGPAYNTWLGPVRVSDRDPTSLTNVTGWTDETGAALTYGDLNDFEDTSSDTSYAQTSTDGAAFTTGYDGTVTSPQVAAVQVVYLCQDVGDATSTLDTTLTVDAVESAPVPVSVPPTMDVRAARFDTAPDGTPWTAAKANAVTVKTVGNL